MSINITKVFHLPVLPDVTRKKEVNKIAFLPVYVMQLRDGGYAYEAIAENTVDAAGNGPCGFTRGLGQR
jgi:hypothetical protein